jgi:PrtD family type I secretion system ABC transporter
MRQRLRAATEHPPEQPPDAPRRPHPHPAAAQSPASEVASPPESPPEKAVGTDAQQRDQITDDTPPARDTRPALRHLSDVARDKLTRFLEGGKPALESTHEATTHSTAIGQEETEVSAAIRASRDALIATAAFSLAINILMLTGPIFMLQVYDRVLTSGSMPTLVVLSLLVIVLYSVVAALEFVRSRVVVRIGCDIDQRLANRVFEASIRQSLRDGGQNSALRDLDSVRQFLSGPGPITFFDAPWTPIYLLVIFLIHWTLGVAALIGAGILVGLAWLSEATGRGPLTEAGRSAARSMDLAEDAHRNGEALSAMGMMGDYARRWHATQREALDWQRLAADRLGTTSALSKALRLLMQSLMLAVGAALAVAGLISAGSIVAATIIFGRAMAPVEQAIAHWRGFVRAREAHANLASLLQAQPPAAQGTRLPAPVGHLEANGLSVSPPGAARPVLQGIQFRVGPGEMLAVIGPSASGKSSLVRTLVGVWPLEAGVVKLDGAPLDQWDPESLGRNIGFLPQNVEIFSGTVRENIARFRSDAGDEEVVEAAKQACCHGMILKLPHGYDTPIGTGGMHLSAGQRQRIGLARALFRRPALVVLDEPNANLDREGDEALTAAISGMRERSQAIVIVSHRVQAIHLADHLLYLDQGKQIAFGPKQQVMQLFQPKAPSGPQRRRTDVAKSGPAFDNGDKI